MNWKKRNLKVVKKHIITLYVYLKNIIRNQLKLLALSNETSQDEEKENSKGIGAYNYTLISSELLKNFLVIEI